MNENHPDSGKGTPHWSGQTRQEEMLRYSAEIAERYPPLPIQETELVLMDIDPHRLYAYWHVKDKDLTRALKAAGSPYAPLVLRMYDVTEDPAAPGMVSTFDVDIEGEETRRYIEVNEDGRSYQAHLGVRISDGSLVFLARSEPVRLPRAGQASVCEAVAVDTSILGKRTLPQVDWISRFSSPIPRGQVGGPGSDRPAGPPGCEKRTFPMPDWPIKSVRKTEPPLTTVARRIPVPEVLVPLPSDAPPLAGTPIREGSWERLAASSEFVASSAAFARAWVGMEPRALMHCGGRRSSNAKD